MASIYIATCFVIILRAQGQPVAAGTCQDFFRREGYGKCGKEKSQILNPRSKKGNSEADCCEESDGLQKLIFELNKDIASIVRPSETQKLILSLPTLELSKERLCAERELGQMANTEWRASVAELYDSIHKDAGHGGEADQGDKQQRFGDWVMEILSKATPADPDQMTEAITCGQERLKVVLESTSTREGKKKFIDKCNEDKKFAKREAAEKYMDALMMCITDRTKMFNAIQKMKGTSIDRQRKSLQECLSGSHVGELNGEIENNPCFQDIMKLFSENTKTEEQIRRNIDIMAAQCAEEAAYAQAEYTVHARDISSTCNDATDLTSAFQTFGKGLCQPEINDLITDLNHQNTKLTALSTDFKTMNHGGSEFHYADLLGDEICLFALSREQLKNFGHDENKYTTLWTHVTTHLETKVKKVKSSKSSSSASISIGVPGIFSVDASTQKSKEKFESQSVEVKMAVSFDIAKKDVMYPWFPNRFLSNQKFVWQGKEEGFYHSGDWETSPSLSYRESLVLCRNISMSITFEDEVLKDEMEKQSSGVGGSVTFPISGVPVSIGGGYQNANEEGNREENSKKGGASFNAPGPAVCGYVLRMISTQKFPVKSGVGVEAKQESIAAARNQFTTFYKDLVQQLKQASEEAKKSLEKPTEL